MSKTRRSTRVARANSDPFTPLRKDRNCSFPTRSFYELAVEHEKETGFSGALSGLEPQLRAFRGQPPPHLSCLKFFFPFKMLARFNFTVFLLVFKRNVQSWLIMLFSFILGGAELFTPADFYGHGEGQLEANF